MKTNIKIFFGCLLVVSLATAAYRCKGKASDTDNGTDTVATAKPIGPMFNADSAYAFTTAQRDFGPCVMDSAAHDKCDRWIVEKFKEYGCDVQKQKADPKAYDDTVLESANIIARFNPEAKKRILICVHWDSRPWADNDPDSTNHKKPAMAANDGASGVTVMLELARQSQVDRKLKVGVDFVCFNAEDQGIPRWETRYQDDGDSWALDAQYYVKNFPTAVKPEFGILLDMVGSEDAQFYREGMSVQSASDVVSRMWRAAKGAGFDSYLPDVVGGMVTDDHVPVDQFAGIPTIDIIPYYPDCQQNSFGPAWHTVNDTMEHINKNTLLAISQTVVRVLCTL